MSKIPPPIKGMKLTPAGLHFVGGADFVACMIAMAKQSEMRAEFTKDTGFDLDRILVARGIERMVDEATGHQAATIAAFADWVCEHVWGVET